MPTQVTTRRDPGNSGKGFSTRHGFTIIELMITIAVVAIITSLALPSYQTIMEKRQVTSAAEQIGAFLSAVQIEAVKRNESIAVRYQRTDSDTWCLGLVTVAAGSTSNTPCDCSVAAGQADACEIDGELRVFSNANLNRPDIMDNMDGDGAFVFDPVRGLKVEPADTSAIELLSGQGKYALNVEVAATGRVRICSKAGAGKDVPGFKECT